MASMMIADSVGTATTAVGRARPATMPTAEAPARPAVR